MRALTRVWMLLVVSCAVLGGAMAESLDRAHELQSVEAWRAKRIANLTREDGWLTLVGLWWLREGDNGLGRAASNRVKLDHAALPAIAGKFVLQQGRVSFEAAPDSPVQHNGKPVQRLELKSDAQGEPTILSAGSLRFFVIERSGKLGIRMRDTEHPARKSFSGIDHYPVNDDWIVEATYETYTPARQIPIANIIGSTDPMLNPGALVFTRNGKAYRVDALLNSALDKELFIIFADETSGRETYGAGRYMYVPRPAPGAKLLVNFNKAYNPPCAFNDFATCPLPPRQNRLPLKIEAGEKTYGQH